MTLPTPEPQTLGVETQGNAEIGALSAGIADPGLAATQTPIEHQNCAGVGDIPKYKQQVERACLVCGMKFFALKHDVERGRGLMCSIKCVRSYAGKQCAKKHPQTGAGNFNYKGGVRRPSEKALHIRAQKVIDRALEWGWIGQKPCPDCGAPRKASPGYNFSHPLESVIWTCPNPNCPVPF